MKVLTLASTYPRWENDTEPMFVHNLAVELKNPHDIFALTPHTPNSKREELIDGIKVFRFKYAPTSWQNIAYDGGINSKLKKNKLNYLALPFFFIFQIYAILKLHKKYNFDLIHAHWIIPQGMCALIARHLMKGNKPKIIVTSHGGDLFSLQGGALTRIKKMVLRNSDKITVVSKTMKDLIDNWSIVPPTKISVYPMSVDLTKRFTPGDLSWNARSNLIYTGRLAEKKGVEFLINAMKSIVTASPEVKLTIIGDGPLKDDLIDLTNKLNLTSNITFLGAIENAQIPALLQKAKIAIFPSIITSDGDQEGLGLTIIEAMGCGCLAICSDLEAIKDIVESGHTGYLFPQKSSSELSALVLRTLRSDQSASIAYKGSLYVKDQFDKTVCRKNYSELYLSLAKGSN